jgi:ABC-2 type transport system permease protein
VYERINFGTMIFYFLLFFIAGYLFYASFFAAIGATSGTESDGQQFVLPILIILSLALYAGYFTLMNPSSEYVALLHYLPFTSPIVVMVKLAQGYEPGHIYELWLSLFILCVSVILFISIAARLYKNGLLQFGHRLKLSLLIKWLKKT